MRATRRITEARRLRQLLRRADLCRGAWSGSGLWWLVCPSAVLAHYPSGTVPDA
jgi:hypothetical protein